ncbi:hypothetical protein ACSS6W_008760 [Trichoderma asperelloides]
MSKGGQTRHLVLDQLSRVSLLRDQSGIGDPSTGLPIKDIRTHPTSSTGKEDAGVFFIGTATTILEWRGIRVLTDPNFLHAGDHVHLGPGVTSQRRTNPAIELDKLPELDCILLSHYHEDHFDRIVEDSLNRDFPIVTTPHATRCLTSSSRSEPFKSVYALDFFESMLLECRNSSETGNDESATPAIKVTGMPGKHVPPGPISKLNDLLNAVPPTNGWLLELGWATGMRDISHHGNPASEFRTSYRIYISGDTLFVDELKEIPKWLEGKQIDLMLIHLGGTTIPGAFAPLVMVTMDAKQGLQLIRLINPDITIPIHYDDYDVFLSPLTEFMKEIEQAGLQDRVVYLDRGDQYRFTV